MDYKKSKVIYRELILGKYINRRIFEEGSMKDSLLFTEIEECFNEYFELYQKIGFTLENSGGSFFLSQDEVEDLVQKQQIKEYVLMLVIIRGIVESKRNMDGFTDFRFGIAKKEMDEMIGSQSSAELLDSAEISKHSRPVEEILVKRNIIFINAKGNYVTTEAGKHFLEIITSYGSKLLVGEM